MAYKFPGDFTPTVIATLYAALITVSIRRARNVGYSVCWTLVPLSMVLGLQTFARRWYEVVCKTAPEPYLDEVFHVPQAQKYCEGKYLEWDDKITTPPGLYLIDTAFRGILRISQCSTASLRLENVVAIVATGMVAAMCRSLLETRLAQGQGKQLAQPLSFYAMHTGLNIALLPVLFFFSGLYYTDVYSTLMVLVTYYNHLCRLSPHGKSLLNDLWTIVIGIMALLMRQTNIFWVVVFQGGVEVAHAVKTLQHVPEAAPRFNTLTDVVRYYAWRYSVGDIHDPPLNIAWLDDWFFALLSIAVAAICNPLRVLKQVWPHISLMGLFGGFVLWNGSVVLGDKSNHVATIHLAQMLYIWPLFTFFSGPLLLPAVSPFLDIVRNAYSINFNHRGTIPRDPHEPAGSSSRLSSHYRRDPKKKRPSAKGESTTPPGPDSSSFSLQAVDALVRSKLYYIPYFLSTLLASFLIVHYNTIIHPFTLADNRHYMFYVFRYTIRRPGHVRYYLIPAYTFCRLACWACLSGSSLRLIDSQDQPAPVRFWSRPFADAPATARAGEQRAEEQAAARPPPMLPHVGMLDSPDSGSALAPPTSAAALWLLATALSLVTAPLVEPRYFILPWVFWRLLVPANRRLSTEPLLPGWLRRLAGKVDLRLVLETAWFVAVNLGTMYIFVTRPFVWRSEDGEVLDGGRVQRFMW